MAEAARKMMQGKVSKKHDDKINPLGGHGGSGKRPSLPAKTQKNSAKPGPY